MGNFYTYLIASLPMLHFEMKLPFSSLEFLRRCQELLPEDDVKILTCLPEPQDYGKKIFNQPTINKWIAFDAALRNELARIRAGRKHVEVTGYLRPEGEENAPYLTQAAWQLYRNPSILDTEKTFDQMRWKALDELVIGHHFDLDFLIAYAYKLQILERWENIRRANARGLLEETLKKE